MFSMDIACTNHYDRMIPMLKKIILTLMAAVYALSPYDILPDFLLGWGWLDDIIILYLLWRYVYAPAKKTWEYSGGNEQGQRSYQENTSSSGRQNERGYSQPDNPYAVLGIGRDATDEDIQKAYKALANKYHPDKVQHLGEEFQELAEKRFKKIQHSYQILMKEKTPRGRT